MKLAFKVVFLLVLGIVILLFIDGYVTIERERKSFEVDTQNDARLLGHALRVLIADVWKTSGEARARQLIEDVNQGEHRIRIRWVWLDAGPGDSDRPRVASGELGTVALGKEATVTRRGPGPTSHMYTYVPIAVAGARTGALELSQSLETLHERTAKASGRVIVLTLGISLFGVLMVSVLGIGMIGRPLRRLADKARRVGQGDLSGRLNMGGSDELARVAREIDNMCDRLGEAQQRVREETEKRVAALEQLRHSDRLKTVGTMASGVAHELGTPLNVISARAGIMANGDEPPAEMIKSASIIKAQAARMTAIIQQLLDFSRRRAPRRALVDLAAVARRCIEAVESLAAKQKVAVSLAASEAPCRAMAEEGQLQQVIMNLVMNAIDATPEGGSVEVRIGRDLRRRGPDKQGEPHECLHIEVRDTGAGISNDDLPHIFEPFFTTKDIGQGAGLGLSISYGIIAEHGGWIDVHSEPGRGSCLTVCLPQEREA